MGSVPTEKRWILMRWRTVGRVAVTALVGLLLPVAVAAVGIAGATGEIYTPRTQARTSTGRHRSGDVRPR